VWPPPQPETVDTSMPDPMAAAAQPPLPRERHTVDAGVTQSADWDWDEDPDSYSAPV
jgi:hypothetical protein